MSGALWGGVWAVVVVGGWAGAQLRGALKTRHERRMEREALEDRRREAVVSAARPPEPVCGCGHHLAQHDKQGVCHQEVSAPVEWNGQHEPVRYAPKPCTCQQYVGPQPLATLYAPELTDLDHRPLEGPR